MVECSLYHGLHSLIRLCCFLYLHKDAFKGIGFLFYVWLGLWFIISDWSLFSLSLFLLSWLPIWREKALLLLLCVMRWLTANLLIKLAKHRLVLRYGKWSHWCDHFVAQSFIYQLEHWSLVNKGGISMTCSRLILLHVRGLWNALFCLVALALTTLHHSNLSLSRLKSLSTLRLAFDPTQFIVF
jgi:hypothetical protein